MKTALVKEGREAWFLATGRLKDFERANIIGALGTDWCPADSDRNFLEAIYQGKCLKYGF